MRKRIENTRFPHRVRILRKGEEDAFSAGVDELIHEGACRSYNNTSLRTFHEKTQSGRVIRADYAIDMPLSDTSRLIRVGDVIELERYGVVDGGWQVNDLYIGTLGVTLYYMEAKN